MSLFRKRKRQDPALKEALADVLAGKDVHEGSPFYEKLTPEEGAKVELLFGRAGQSVALYVLQRGTEPPASEEERLSLAAKAMFADASATAEFHLRCQQSDPGAVAMWFAGYCDECWKGFVETNPASSGFDEVALAAEARALIDRNWTYVMTMATAYAAPSVDVDGREFEFLDNVYVDPDDEDPARPRRRVRLPGRRRSPRRRP
jgi:hypothetical protein